MPLKEKLLIALIFLSVAFFIAPRIVFAQVIINEVAWMGTKASSADEWIELYNNSNEPVSLEGWSLNENGNKLIIALKNSIAANSYYLIERTDDSVTNVPADLFGSWGGNGLSNDGEKISLKDSSGNTIDEIDCLSGWFIGKASPDYQTMERTNPASSSLETNWHGNSVAGTSVDAKGNIIQGTPKAANSSGSPAATPTPSVAPSDSSTPAAANSSNNNSASATPSPAIAPATANYEYSQDVLINEFLPAPNDGAKEWVELFNVGSSDVILSGWQIDDADNATLPQIIPTGTIISPNGFLVISFNKNTLNNDGDKVRLLWPDDQVVHAVAYDKAKPGQAVAKFDTGWLWTNQPTPGQVNKKFFIEKNEAVTLAGTTNSADQITAIEETVSTRTNAPRPGGANNQNAVSAEITRPENNSTIDQAIQNPNLIAAAAGEPLKNNSGLNTILALGGVILLSAAAAGGLIHFKRQNSVDRENFDD